MYLDKLIIVHEVKVCAHTSTHLSPWMSTHLFLSFLSLLVFLPLFLSLYNVPRHNLLCSLQSNYKSFSLLNKIHRVSLGLSGSSFHPNRFPLSSGLSSPCSTVFLPFFFLLSLWSLWPFCQIIFHFFACFFLPPLVLSSYLCCTSPSVSLQTVSLKLVDGMGLFAPVRWKRKNEWSLVMLLTVSGP